MLIVYQIKKDARFQHLIPVEAEEDLMPWMDCTFRSENWVPIEMYNPMPTLLETDFYNVRDGYFLFTEATAEKIGVNYLEDRGEFLPVKCLEKYCPAENLYIYNVWHCINCLDHKETTWHKVGKTQYPKNVVFNSERLPAPGVFKIPELRATTLFACVNTNSPYDNFKDMIETKQLTGLKFEPVWNDGDS